MRKIAQIIFVITVILTSCMTTKENSVNHTKYLGTDKNPSEIYNDTSSDSFYSPLNMQIYPMEKLMLVDIEGDSLYSTIELQVYNDERGKGATVILYKKNGDTDVYYTDLSFVITSLFTGNLYENREIKYSMDVINNGIKAFVELSDKYGREIIFKINEEKNTSVPKSFLAPVGGIIKTFTFFPLFYMKNFSFVKRSGTEISIRIDNRYLKAKKIPILLNGSFVYLSRYSTEPVICAINDEYNGELKSLVPQQKNKFIDGNMTYDLVNNNGHYEIKKATCDNSKNKVSISFSPAIPDIVNLRNGFTIIGKFSTEIDSITGIMAGEYQITRMNNEINFTMNPLKAYSPMTGILWVLAYKWKSDITITNDSLVNLNSQWIKSFEK